MKSMWPPLANFYRAGEGGQWPPRAPRDPLLYSVQVWNSTSSKPRVVSVYSDIMSLSSFHIHLWKVNILHYSDIF